MNPLEKAVDSWFGRGEASITMPPMDGAFRPNDLLDSRRDAPRGAGARLPGGHLARPGRLVRALAVAASTSPDDAPLASFDAEISALTGLPDGGAAVGLIDGRIVVRRRRARRNDDRDQPGDRLHHGARGRARRRAARRQWLGDQRAGGLEARPDGEERFRVRMADRPRQRRSARSSPANLAYPYGLLEDAGSVVVSESWRCALTRILPGAGGRTEPVLENLPAYPEPAVAGRRRSDLARPVCAAQPACRIRPERKPLSPAA